MELTIDPRFNGPPNSGHGGYVTGLIAGLFPGPARVRLHRPPPLGRALAVRRDGESVSLLDADAVVATGTPATIDVDVPSPVSFANAEVASRAYPGFRNHAFSHCFGCGPARAVGDGLRIFPGPVPGRGLVAAPWVPDGWLGDAHGSVRPEFLWAALDCPSGWAPIVEAGGTPMVLGEMAAHLRGRIQVGERSVVMAWSRGGEGRKRLSDAVLLGEDGTPRAVARATWITLATR